jgi:hypothetical protein
MALYKIKYLDVDFSKVEIYIYRQNKNGERALAYPCKACKRFMKDIGIKHIYYTGNNSFCYERME